MSSVAKLRLIKDNIHASIDVSQVEFDLIHDRFVNRLRYILQQGQVEAVYPSASHTRFIHSLGVMHLAGEAFKYALSNASVDDRKKYLTHSSKSLIQFINDLSGIWPDILYSNEHADPPKCFQNIISWLDSNEDKLNLSDVYGQEFITSKIISEEKNKLIYVTMLSIVRLAGLFHDVGHLPLSHLSEQIILDKLPEYVSRVENINLIPDKLQIHENLKSAIILKSSESIKKKYTDSDCQYTYIAIQLLVINELHSVYPELHSIIDNILDVDVLDYVIRDGNATGVIDIRYDIERIIKTYYLVAPANTKSKQNQNQNNDTNQSSNTNTNNQYLIVPHVKAIKNIENVLKSRMAIYKIVVGHHKSRKYESYYRIIISKILDKMRNSRSKKYNNVFNGMFIRSFNELINQYAIIIENSSPIGESISQNYHSLANPIFKLNDNALHTWLQNIYSTLKISDPSISSNDKMIKLLLEEIFGGDKIYSVVWKDYSEMYDYLKRAIGCNMYDIQKNINDYFSLLQGEVGYEVLSPIDWNILALNCPDDSSDDNSDDNFVNYTIHSILNRIISISGLINIYDQHFYKYKDIIAGQYNVDGSSIYSLLRSQIREYIFNEHRHDNEQLHVRYILDEYFMILSPNIIKPGGSYSSQYVLTRTNNTKNIQEVSNIRQVLLDDILYTVPFYIYKKNHIDNQILASSTISSIFKVMSLIHPHLNTSTKEKIAKYMDEQLNHNC